MSRIATLAMLLLIVAGCGVGTSPDASLQSAPSAAATMAGGVVLNRAPADLGCDAVGWPEDVEPFSSLTFRVDPTAADHVTARSDTGVNLTVEWVPGFEGGAEGQRAVVGPDGEVLIQDGETIELPAGSNPELHGYPLCVTPTTVAVMAMQSGG
jgi:hypothetical protein